MSKNTDPKIRKEIIKVLDEEDIWEHVIMNYLHFAPMRISKVGCTPKVKNIHRRLNNAIGDVMMSYQDIRSGK